ncbi:hypothetical protein EYF80_004896 [Liparis tanakae]|uniref:Uncharacterized protein n=1 Tax=Liparis tanakae TaxID=230148 RepID=A0A4Z2J4H8_9TELE|nr:hypothetical protein EYF80_004896 [Liparis tanakae]
MGGQQAARTLKASSGLEEPRIDTQQKQQMQFDIRQADAASETPEVSPTDRVRHLYLHYTLRLHVTNERFRASSVPPLEEDGALHNFPGPGINTLWGFQLEIN